MDRIFSAASAQRIVDEIGSLLQRELLIAQPDGMIIAASDLSLAGRQVDLHPQDNPSGDLVRADTLLPVMISGEIACVVGFYGTTKEGHPQPEGRPEMHDCSRVLSTMTGVLISALRDRQRETEVRGARDRFLEEWLFSATLPDDKSLETRGRQLGIDVNRARTAGVLLLDTQSPDEELGEYALVVEGILELLRKANGTGRDIPVTAVGNRIVLLLDTDSVSIARERLETSRLTVESAYPIHAYGGVGMPRKTFADMRDSAREAERAARNAQSAHRRSILAFGDIALELFLQEVPAKVWREYRSRVLRGLSESEAAEWSRLLAVYFQADGSLSDAAAMLGIHKNTLQYRLRRLASLTGHDPRRLRDALSLYLATMMDENRV